MQYTCSTYALDSVVHLVHMYYIGSLATAFFQVLRDFWPVPARQKHTHNFSTSAPQSIYYKESIQSAILRILPSTRAQLLKISALAYLLGSVAVGDTKKFLLRIFASTRAPNRTFPPPPPFHLNPQPQPPASPPARHFTRAQAASCRELVSDLATYRKIHGSKAGGDNGAGCAGTVVKQ